MNAHQSASSALSVCSELFFDRESEKPWHLHTVDLGAQLTRFVNGLDAVVLTQTAEAIHLLRLPLTGPIHLRPADLSREVWDRIKAGTYRYRRTA